MDASRVISNGARNAAARAEGDRATGSQSSAFDVWTHTLDGMDRRLEEFAADPAAALLGDPAQAARVNAAMAPENWARASRAAAGDSMAAQATANVGRSITAISEADGALATAGAVFGALTAAEQMLSTALSVIPFPAFPAIRITDLDVGLPHAHSHPPNLTPPNPVPVPLPSTGPVIPLPIVSGASRTLINGMPAGRCGDLGMSVFCGGFFPLYEIFLGSSSVWIEGARAARLGVDITKHCLFSTPRPNDPPMGPCIGMTVSSSPNVLIGGVPVPSLTSFVAGAAIRGVFKGLSRLAGAAVSRVRGVRELSRIAQEVNPGKGTVNCGNIIDAVVDRLRGRNPRAVAPLARDGSFAQIEARFGTTLRWGQSFDDAFKAVRNGGDGTTAVVGIRYPNNGGSHVVIMTNRRGVVGIVEGQNWGAGKPAEVITSPRHAKARYGSASDVGVGVIP